MEAVNTTDEKDPIEELFGEVIYSYTDEQAVEDGVLVKLEVKGFDTRHRVTANAYQAIKEHHDQHWDWTDKHYQNFILREILPLAGEAYRRWNEEGILALDYDFKVEEKANLDHLWLIPNERGGVTLMLPSDY